MNLQGKIKKSASELENATLQLKKYEEFGSNRKSYLKYSARQQFYNNEINRYLIPVVKDLSQPFNKLATKNYRLLQNDKFAISTTRKSYSFFGNYATFFTGSLHVNGCFYCETKETNFPFLFSDYQYPKKLQGQIDCMGNIQLKTTITGYAFFKRVPVSFEGRISANGMIEVYTVECDPDFFSEGKHIISKIIGSPFENRSGDWEQFISNRNQLNDLLHDYRKANNIVTI